jgi:hypothetical protein
MSSSVFPVRVNNMQLFLVKELLVKIIYTVIIQVQIPQIHVRVLNQNTGMVMVVAKNSCPALNTLAKVLDNILFFMQNSSFFIFS